jgi:ABC-type enterobactin transport system permease subunit
MTDALPPEVREKAPDAEKTLAAIETRGWGTYSIRAYVTALLTALAQTQAERDEAREAATKWEWVAGDLADTAWCHQGTVQVQSAIDLALARYVAQRLTETEEGTDG